LTKNTKHKWNKKQIAVNTRINHYLKILGIIFATAVIVSFSLAVATSSAENIKVAGSETQFELNVAYAYVGKCTANTSYTDSNGRLMSLVSQYPSAVVFNITRLSGVRFPSCEAIIEVYGVHIATDTGKVEHHAYIVGTNYSASFSPDSELPSFLPHINNLIDKTVYITVKGDLCFNWTDNTSILSHTVGSACCYSNFNSTLGLWKSGKPNAIIVTVDRIGYITMDNSSISIYKHSTTTNTTTVVQLGNYEDGFLHNTIVPAAKLQQATLFEPAAANQLTP
jgi:hypothetical protein